MAAALDHQLDSNDAWLPARRHTDTAVAFRAGAPKVPLVAARGFDEAKRCAMCVMRVP